MKKRLLALMLVGACLLLFAGCSQDAQDMAASLASLTQLKDFQFSDHVQVAVTDQNLTATGEEADAAQASENTLVQDDQSDVVSLTNITSIDYLGAVSASRDQFYLEKTIHFAEGDPVVYTLTMNDGQYVVTANGTPVAGGDISTLIAEIGSDLQLMGINPDDLTNVVTSKEFLEKISKDLPDVLDQISDNVSKTADGRYLFDVKDKDFSKVTACILSGLGMQEETIKKINRSIDVSLKGSLVVNNGSATSDTDFKAVKTYFVKTDKEGCPVEKHELAIDITNSIGITPIVADANVDVDSITADSASVIVSVSPGDTIASQGIIISTDSDNKTSAAPVEAALQDGRYVVPLTSLQPGTTYYYQGYGVDKAGFTVVSGIKHFTTLAASSGTVTPPPTSTSDNTPIPNPKTGDHGTMIAVITLASSSLLLSGLTVFRKKRRYN